MEEKIVIKKFQDVPILSVSLQSTLWNKTGNWRYLRPAYASLRSPCSRACPIGQDIASFITALADGQPGEAWRMMLEGNPFPSVCGRVCHHPCEGECNRKEYDGAVAVNSLERFLGDWGMKHGGAPRKEAGKNGTKVAVVGSGPAGLSCAYFLARRGRGVKVFEAAGEPGGMMRCAIPAYRLPRRILEKEIERIVSLGVEIETGKRLGSDLGMEDLKGYAAAFLATGAHAEQKPKIPGSELKGVINGLAFLKETNAGGQPVLGRRVIVVGGGNTAIDSARTALRLGKKVTVLYRRRKEEMPAIAAEVEEAQKEGVRFVFQAVPLRIAGRGKVQSLECLRTKPGKTDAGGRRAPVPLKDSNFKLAADAMILALGEKADLSFLPDDLKIEDGRIAVDAWGRTSLPGIFAGGDAATGAGYVSRAIASGKRTAEAIDRYLRGERRDPAEDAREVVRFEKLNLDYFTPRKRSAGPLLKVSRRVGGFQEVQKGLSPGAARREAERCFSCGNCLGCNVCLMVCPDVAISFREEENAYAVDYDHCKGCGICAVECPRSAMTLEEEKWNG